MARTWRAALCPRPHRPCGALRRGARAADAALIPDRKLHASVVPRPRGYTAQAVSRFFALHAAARAAPRHPRRVLHLRALRRASTVAGLSPRSPSLSLPSRRYRYRCGSTHPFDPRTIVPSIVAASGARVIFDRYSDFQTDPPNPRARLAVRPRTWRTSWSRQIWSMIASISPCRAKASRLAARVAYYRETFLAAPS